MRILVIGDGGREHAICWKLSQSRNVSKIFTSPGNPGTARVARNENTRIGMDDLHALVAFASTEGVDLTIVGPEKPLAMGIVDRFRERGLAILGPTSDSARLGSSEDFAQETLNAAGVPLTDQDPKGEDFSFSILSDGYAYVPLTATQDHRSLFDGDTGPITEGMGAYSPVPAFTPEVQADVEKKIVRPLLASLAQRELPYTGVLAIRLVLTPSGPQVSGLEVQPGDPETQTFLPRLDSDLAELFLRTVRGRLSGAEVRWKPGATMTVVLASEGYPHKPLSGQQILGTEKASDQALLFHSGTRMDAEHLIVSGGRVLSLTALAPTLREARNQVYRAVERIDFGGKLFRKDIGWRVSAAPPPAL